MVKAQTGIDYWQVLKKMYQGQGEKSLEGYRKRISKEWTSSGLQYCTLIMTLGTKSGKMPIK